MSKLFDCNFHIQQQSEAYLLFYINVFSLDAAAVQLPPLVRTFDVYVIVYNDYSRK